MQQHDAMSHMASKVWKLYKQELMEPHQKQLSDL